MKEYQINLDCICVESSFNYIYGGWQGNLIILEFVNQSQISLISTSNNQNGSAQESYYVIKVDQFVYISNYLYGLSIFNVEDLHNPIFVITLKIVGAQSTQSYLFQNEKILYTNSEYYGVYIVDVSDLYQDQSKFITTSEQSNLISKVSPDVVLNQFAITSDEKLFFLGVRSIGIQIYDISNLQNKMNPVFLQLISAYGNFSNMIFFGSNYRYFAVSTESNILIFQQTVEIEDQDYVGLYRQNLSVNIQLDQKIDDYFSLCLVNNLYLVVRGGLTYQFYVLDLSLPYSYQLIVKSPFLLQEFVVNGILKKSALYHLEKRQYLLLAYSKKIFVYETQSKNSLNQPQFDLTYIFSLDFVYQVNDMTSSSNEDYLFMCYSKFIIVLDIRNITDFKVVQIIEKLEQFTNDYSSIALAHDDKFGIITVLQQAAIFFELDSHFQIKYLSNLSLYGAFQVEYDKGGRNLFFIADGISGVTIIDSSDRKDPKIKSTYYMNKQIISIFQPFSMQNSLLLNESQLSIITVINFSDLDKIKTVQSFFDTNEESHQCIIDSFNRVMIVMEMSNIKIYFLEKQAKILRQNFFISQMSSSTQVMFDFQNKIDEKKIKLEAQNEYAQIGEDCVIYFFPYYIQNQYQIQSLKVFYEPYEQQNILPSWISLDKVYQVMQFNPPKELFTGQNTTLLFQIQLQTIFENTDFILTSLPLNISSANSLLIHQKLVKKY
ncbi:hypothetical protein TTHERM_00322870 (macronuclear) [Tetrahymena thermophila SB210]|uniref:Uncharacterized protein n=1 Tax=Tetrahymena thermophila (strain SB210) TaxID=312017 RepID=Q237J8_TETTS|nr:hypothetical protein TTHERM_00322870 [Tetrahymena thermophila SB210]EAR92743.2 hypothetical protein TTHERM_00322870 [Tetrahymena thermophila SB210]|eukprot:XP_001012988.2 hypothetical protein TTHERM_00322870 [Tetrahymena thermophila SB210]